MQAQALQPEERLAAVGWGGHSGWASVGFSWRKHRLLKQWLGSFGAGGPATKRVQFVWGAPGLQRGQAPDESGGLVRVHVEDGLLRSAGLGADLVAPISWVFDTRGIYFDARTPSDLEVMLRECAWSDAQRSRARALRERIVALGVGKYNLNAQPWTRPAGVRRVVLVVGQVESDASIRWGASRVRTNAELLRAARACEPDAYLVYKPHPDVEAGLRAGSVPDPVGAGLCNARMKDTAIETVWAQIDALHVNTSLAGFEALLRGVPVVTHGQPFYAGWGLTQDLGLSEAVCARRCMPLTLDALVYASLIAYPSYRHPLTGAILSAEEAVAWLAQERGHMAKPARWRRAVLAAAARLQRRY